MEFLAQSKDELTVLVMSSLTVLLYTGVTLLQVNKWLWL